MDTDAAIVAQYRDGLGPTGKTVYSWEGQGTRALVSYRVLRGLPRLSVGQAFSLQELRLRVVQDHLMYGGYIVMRDGWRARVWVVAYRVLAPLRWVNVRLILTAELWGLGRWESTQIVTWRNVYIVDWIARRLGR